MGRGCWDIGRGGKNQRGNQRNSRFLSRLASFQRRLGAELKSAARIQSQCVRARAGERPHDAAAADGTVLMTRYDIGEVVALRDNDGDGVADETPVVASIPLVHGLALRSNVVYLASETKLFTMTLGPGGTFGAPSEFAQLPPGGLHPRRTIGFDDAGWFYVSVGSDCNNCGDQDPELAALLRMKPDGSERMVFAHGLRNMIGFAWHRKRISFGAWTMALTVVATTFLLRS